MKKLKGLASAVIISGFAFSCNNGPEVRKLKPGEKVTLMPVKSFHLAKEPKKYPNIFVHFNMGGKSLSYNESTKIEIYYKGIPEEPKFVFEARDLKTMHQDTKCAKDMDEILSNAYEGDAVFCNSFLDLDKIDHFKAIRTGKSNKSSTLYTVEGVFEEYDLIKIGVGMH